MSLPGGRNVAPRTRATTLGDARKTYLYKDVRTVDVFAKRLVFLFFTVLVLIGSGFLYESYESVLLRNIELAFFLPVVIGNAGNIGNQISATTARELACDNHLTHTQRIYRDTLIGTCSSIILCAPISLAMYLMHVPRAARITVYTSFVALGSLSSMVSSLGCVICVFLGIDPAKVMGPFITSFADTIGILMYFGVANRLSS